MPGDLGRALRARVVQRAYERCEYCKIHQNDAGFAHHVDHIISRKHGGQTIETNLALACFVCNRHKGSDISSLTEHGQLVRLFHPRRDRWDDHLAHDGPRFRPLSAIGEATIRILRLNAPERVEERRILQVLGRYPGR